MADNVSVSEGSGKVIAADDIGGVCHQRVKVSIGADGEAADLDSGQATMANSIPVALASDQTFATVAATFLYNSMAAGSITNSYQAVLTDSNNKRYIQVYNQTDGTLLVSFNGTNDHAILFANQSITYQLGTLARHCATNVSVKYSTQPTTGSCYVQAIY